MSRKQKKKISEEEKLSLEQAQKEEKLRKNRRIIITIVCILLGVILVFGAILGIIVGVRNANAVMVYDGVSIDEGVTNYLLSYYKTHYIQSLHYDGVDVMDTAEFWNSTVLGNTTYGMAYRAYSEEFLKQLVATNKIFDKYASLTSDDKKKIDDSVEEVLLYKASGSKAKFNEQCEAFGFDFSDFRVATEMLYKVSVARERIYGANGENMQSFPEICDEYYEGYSHVYLVFVRTDTTFVLDGEGNRVTEGGADVLRPLTDAEKAERERRIEELTACVGGLNDGEVNPQRFFELMEEYDEGDKGYHVSGYYFHTDSLFTKEFYVPFPEVIKEAVSLNSSNKVASVAEITNNNSVENSFSGKCFIYKTQRPSGAYADVGNACFSDFYKNAAVYMHDDMVKSYTEGVLVKDKWAQIDAVAIPYNSVFVAKFS